MAGETILIVEDNALNRKLVQAVLRRFDYRLLTAENAEEGLDITFREKPDLILMDIQLPKMNGIEAVKIIRATSAVKKIPIIALTAHALPEERSAALAAGCSEYLTKPIDPHTFPEQIRRFLIE